MAAATLVLEIRGLHGWVVMASYGLVVISVTALMAFVAKWSVFSFEHRTLHGRVMVLVMTLIR